MTGSAAQSGGVLLDEATPTVEALVGAALAQPPDARSGGAAAAVVVADATGRDEGGALEALAAARAAHPAAVPVVVVDDAPPASLLPRLLDDGARTVVPVGAAPTEVRAALDAAARGTGLVDVGLVRPSVDASAARLAESRRRDRAVIESLAAAVEAKDRVTSLHLGEVSRLARQLAGEIDPGLARCEDFLFGCLLHDVGKIGVPEAILGKPGPLTEAEWETMRRHPATGAGVIAPLGLAETVEHIVLHHHERWDGGGYPHGLAGESIPLVARIFSVCDALEAMTADRPYRAAMAPADAVEEVFSQAGRQFDPAVVAALQKGLARGSVAVLPGAPGARIAGKQVVGLPTHGLAALPHADPLNGARDHP